MKYRTLFWAFWYLIFLMATTFLIDPNIPFIEGMMVNMLITLPLGIISFLVILWRSRDKFVTREKVTEYDKYYILILMLVAVRLKITLIALLVPIFFGMSLATSLGRIIWKNRHRIPTD
jgi:hypothetical protein